jgi:hypothetical protein
MSIEGEIKANWPTANCHNVNEISTSFFDGGEGEDKVLEAKDRQHASTLCFNFAIENAYDLVQLIKVSSPKLINKKLKLESDALIAQRI